MKKSKPAPKDLKDLTPEALYAGIFKVVGVETMDKEMDQSSKKVVENFLLGVREQDSITEIPDNAVIENDPYKYISSKLIKIGENVTFMGNALLQRTHIKELPKKMTVNGSIYLNEVVNIMDISEDVKFTKEIVQDIEERTRVFDLPLYKKSGGKLGVI